MSEETGSGYGRLLAAAREAKGLTVAQVADKLKLSGRQVEALEAEDTSRLPAPVFVRGFVRNYARLVDLPLDRLPEQVAEVAAGPTETITAHSEGLSFSASPVRRWLLLPLAVFAVFLLLVALLYSWLSRGEEAYVAETPAISSQPLDLPVPPAAPAVDAALVAPTPVDGATAPVADAPDPVAPAAVPVAPAPAAEPRVAAPPVPPAPVPAPQPVVGESDASGRVVQLVADQNDAWIEVVAGNNKRYSRLLRAGEQLTLRGQPPFRLVVGNAAGTRLSYDGRSIDLKPYTGEKVARLTLE